MTLSYRLFVPQYETPAQFERLLSLLEAHRPAVEELAFFTEYWHHGYFPLQDFARRAELIGQRMAQARGRGFKSIGINMLCTLGHVNEAWDFLPALPWQAMIGQDGTVSRCSFCPRTPQVLDYVAEKYRLAARQKPEFIWVDDDVRMQHHGMAYGCFCPLCIKHFKSQAALDVTDRAALVEKLNDPEARNLRRQWVEFNGQSLEELMVRIADAVAEVDPAIELGLMTAGHEWTAYAHELASRCLKALKAPRARPGGGFYDDGVPGQMIEKALVIAQQCATYPDTVRDVQYELENFPYQKLDKSLTILTGECTLALAAGCNGIAFNALKDLPGSLEDYEPLMAQIQRMQSVWRDLADSARGLPLVGLWPATNQHIYSDRRMEDGRSWLDGDGRYGSGSAAALARIGLPLTNDARHACATVFCGRMADLFSDEELRKALAGGVMLDPMGLEVLTRRGLGELAGVRPGSSYENGVYERFTAHALNGRFAGDARDSRVSFWNQPAMELVALDKSVQDLARLVGYDGSDRGSCLSVYENKLGGRVAVLGYAPWFKLGSSAKRSQMLAVAQWITREALPLVIESTVRVAPWLRRGTDRQVLVLLNAGFDLIEGLVVKCQGHWPRALVVEPTGRVELPTASAGEGWTRLVLPRLAPWQAAVVVMS